MTDDEPLSVRCRRAAEAELWYARELERLAADGLYGS